MSVFPLTHILLMIRHGMHAIQQLSAHFQQVRRQSIVRPCRTLQSPQCRHHPKGKSHFLVAPIRRGEVIIASQLSVLYAEFVFLRTVDCEFSLGRARSRSPCRRHFWIVEGYTYRAGLEIVVEAFKVTAVIANTRNFLESMERSRA